MKKLPLFPELEEYINQCKWEEENYSKSTNMKKYDELERELICNLFLEKHHREPSESEIEEEKIELFKIKYLIDTWIDEYFEQIKRDNENSATKKGPRNQ
ncbi:MAG: hypothetical protein BWY19_01022 [bacterium ADurb.Bin212]|nr:MAG: hypothetical protein BWY19_01022 [bacterium ADurb.Bin212]